MVETATDWFLRSPDLIDTLLGLLEAALRSCSLIESRAAADFDEEDLRAATKEPRKGMVQRKWRWGKQGYT